jgi:cobalt-zinc-cadmium efflux system outer membrane protein
MLAGAVLAVGLAGCSTPGPREASDAAVGQALRETAGVRAKWRRSSVEDARLKSEIAPLLADGLSVADSVAIALLANPELQLAFERLEVSRADLVAASTLPNPVLIMGSREPGGHLAPFYPQQTVSIGLLENVLGLLSVPAKRRVAQADLKRAQLDLADRIVAHAAQVSLAYLEYVAARKVLELRERSTAAATTAVDIITVNVANGRVNSPGDLVVERNALFSNQSQLRRAQLQVATTRERLGQLMGIAGISDDWEATDQLQALPAADPDIEGLEERAFAQRLDMRAAREAVATRLETLRTQRRFSWLGAFEFGLFREGQSSQIRFTGPNAVLELPLFDRRQSQLLSSDSQLRSALRQTELLAQQARNELRTHAAEMQATRTLYLNYRDQLVPRQQWLLSQMRSADPSDLGRLRLRLSSIAAEEEATGYLRDYWRARGALARAAGDWSGVLGWSAPKSP